MFCQPDEKSFGAADVAESIRVFVLNYFADELRAMRWEQVRVFVAAGLTANVMSLIGAVYYIFFVGVVSTGLLILLAVYVILAAGFAYTWLKYDRAPATSGSAAKSA